MNKKLHQQARKNWHNVKKVSFTLKMLINKHAVQEISAPEYDASLERDITITSENKALAAIPKVVWMYWHDTHLPASITLMTEKIRRDNPDHEINLLNKATLNRYLPDLIFSSSDISVPHQSDVIRLELLCRYGGIWMDCSMLLFENLSWVHECHEKNSRDLIGYYREVSTVNPQSPIIESWFLAAPQHNPFIQEWLKHLSPIKTLGSKQYFDKMRKRDDYDSLVQKITDPPYLLVYLAQQAAMKEYKHFNIFARKCEANAFYYQRLHGWNSAKFACLIMFNKRPTTPPPIIKLTGNERLHIDFNLRLGFYNPHSIFGELTHFKPSVIIPTHSSPVP